MRDIFSSGSPRVSLYGHPSALPGLGDHRSAFWSLCIPWDVLGLRGPQACSCAPGLSRGHGAWGASAPSPGCHVGSLVRPRPPAACAGVSCGFSPALRARGPASHRLTFHQGPLPSSPRCTAFFCLRSFLNFVCWACVLLPSQS